MIACNESNIYFFCTPHIFALFTVQQIKVYIIESNGVIFIVR
jgi:hypothetical protein